MKKNFKLLLMLVVFAVVILPSKLLAQTITLTKDTVMDEKLTGEDITITGKYTLTLKGGIEATGTLTIEGASVIVDEPGIMANDINISDSFVTSNKTTYGGCIFADNKVTITNSNINVTATEYGDYGIHALNGVTITGSNVVATISGDISNGAIDSNDFITIKNSVLNIDSKSRGISSFNGSTYLENVKATIKSNEEGISSNSSLDLKNCDINVNGGLLHEGPGEDPSGIWAKDNLVIDGGRLIVSSLLSDGIYANDLIEIKSGTSRVEATGKVHALRVWYNKTYGHGEIVIGSNIERILPSIFSFDDTKGYLVDSNEDKIKTLFVGDSNAVLSVNPTVGPSWNTSSTGSNPVVDTPVEKKTNPLKVTKVTKTVKYSKLKKKAQTVKAITVTKNQGGLTYVKQKGSSSKLTINKTTGKITVKKKTKKGTYKIKVKITAKGNSNYKSGSKIVTVTIKVK